MLIWRGWGIIVKFAFIASVVVSILLRQAGLLTAKQVLVMSFLLTGALCWLFGGWLEKRAQRNSRDIIDVQRGQVISRREHHDFFFVPVRLWAYIAWALALTALLGPSPSIDED